MRFLKKKIARAQESKDKSDYDQLILTESLDAKESKKVVEIIETPCSSSEHGKKRKRVPRSPLTPQTTRETKNIVGNYGRAICKFTTSSLALPYLKNFIEQEGEGITLDGYIKFAISARESVNGLHGFRSVLLPEKDDDKQTSAYKKILKLISEVFIKYFSVNWIFNSKIQHKLPHLKFRFKMLRRIRSPELFTYLKN